MFYHRFALTDLDVSVTTGRTRTCGNESMNGRRIDSMVVVARANPRFQPARARAILDHADVMISSHT